MSMILVGVISDTHGLLRDEALAALAGSDLIIHAGDVGDAGILRRLEEIAPVQAVCGNTDYGALAGSLPATEVVEIGNEATPLVVAYVLHDLAELSLDAEAAGFGIVVHGHTHRPDIRHDRNVLYFNPGAAGHRRFSLPVTVGRIEVGPDGSLEPEIVELDVDR